MTTVYYPGFDVSALTLGTLTIADTSGGGGSDIEIALSSQSDALGATEIYRFFHYHTPSGGNTYTGLNGADANSFSAWSTTSFAFTLQSYIRTTITGLGDWPAAAINFTVSFDNDLAQYLFDYTSNFSMTWTLSAGRSLLGFTANQSGSATYTSTIVPTYAVIASRECGFPTAYYEEQGVGKLAVADDGVSVFAIAQHYKPLLRDWVQQFELKAKVLRQSAASTHPWTLQHLIEHCRGVYPFVVHDGFGESYAEAYHLRDDGSFMDWSAARVAPGFDDFFHVPFRCYAGAKITTLVPG